MNLFLLLCLFFLAIFLTSIFILVIKNMGPWNNPKLFFLVLFMTSWSIIVWLGPVTIQNKSYPFLSVTAVVILITLFLAASNTAKREKNKIRRLKDNKVIEMVTKSEDNQERFIPNIFFWILIMIETILIVAAYLVKYIK